MPDAPEAAEDQHLGHGQAERLLVQVDEVPAPVAEQAATAAAGVEQEEVGVATEGPHRDGEVVAGGEKATIDPPSSHRRAVTRVRSTPVGAGAAPRPRQDVTTPLWEMRSTRRRRRAGRTSRVLAGGHGANRTRSAHDAGRSSSSCSRPSPSPGVSLVTIRGIPSR